VIAGSKKKENNTISGWEIATACNGSWTWQMSDGEKLWSYSPTGLLQNLNDNLWHQIAFSVNVKQREARIYFDGKNRAVFSLHGLKKNILYPELVIGSDPLAIDMQMDAFNGLIDNFSIWARALSDKDIKYSYLMHQGKEFPEITRSGDRFKVLTWNISRGGRHYGKKVGVDRIIDVIKGVKPDIVVLQETDGSGEMIADALGFYYFSRSPRLSVLSRFPFGKSYDIYLPETFGCVTVKANNDKEVFVCPVMLDSKPNTGAYVMTGKAIPDTIIDREMETRGLQMRFILGELSSFTINDNNTFILAGDFNSGSHLDWTERNKDKHNGITVEFPVSKMLEREKFIDSYRTLNPDETKDPGTTWSPVFTNTLQDRIDFIYYKGNALTPKSSFVIDSYQYDFPSAHAAVVTVFSLN
jgi:endonuclease/exonuclease/phosphatase family metal-dependent hydrolase